MKKKLSENFEFLVVKFSIYLNRRLFIMFLEDVESRVIRIPTMGNKLRR